MPMAAVSREEVPCGEAGVSSNAEKEERERADAELRHLPDRELQEKKQRLQGMVTSGIRLPDGGRKLEATIDAIDREQDRRQARGGMARATGGDGCERIVRSRCAESSDTMKASHRHRMDQVGRKHGSGFPSDPNRVSKADFQYSFGMDEKVDVDISSLEITTRSRNKPNTSIENEGKLCKEEHSCKPSSLPTNSFHEEMDVDTSSNVEKISPDDASNNNGHNGMCEAAPTPSRKRKGADPANFSMRLRSRKEEVVVLDGDAPHPDSVEETSNNWDAKKLYYPSREHPNSVEISSGDIRCLQPESLLSSPIMNFYIMHLQGPMLSIIRPRGDYHIFNTYFFSKLEAMTSKAPTCVPGPRSVTWSTQISGDMAKTLPSSGAAHHLVGTTWPSHRRSAFLTPHSRPAAAFHGTMSFISQIGNDRYFVENSWQSEPKSVTFSGME